MVWKPFVLFLAIAALFIFFGCSLPEWEGVVKDAAERAPGAALRAASNPSPINMIIEIVGGIGLLVSGWYIRKYGVKYANIRPYNGMATDNPMPYQQPQPYPYPYTYPAPEPIPAQKPTPVTVPIPQPEAKP